MDLRWRYAREDTIPNEINLIFQVYFSETAVTGY